MVWFLMKQKLVDFSLEEELVFVAGAKLLDLTDAGMCASMAASMTPKRG